MKMPALAWLTLAALLGSSPGRAQELRWNPDASTFTVHLDPRARPRMRVDEVIALADEGARETAGDRSVRATIVRIELVRGEELELVMPHAPLQGKNRWYWVVWLRGKFRTGSDPSMPEGEGSLGWALYDDEHRAFIAGGFMRDLLPVVPESIHNR